MKNYQRAILSKNLQVYLLAEIKQINKKRKLNEDFFDPSSWTAEEIGHGFLDIVSIVASLIPGLGSAVSTVADVSNAVWYFSEGKEVIAAIYLLMAVPFVGDVVAVPFQAMLHGGGRLIMEIPLMKNALAHLIGNSVAVKGFLRAAAGKGGKEGLEKAAAKVLEEKASKELIESAIKTVEKIEVVYAREGEAGLVRFLEKEIQKGSINGTVVSKVTNSEAKNITQAAVKDFETQTGKKIGEMGAKPKTAEAFVDRAEKNVGDVVKYWAGKRVGTSVAKAGAIGTAKVIGGIGDPLYDKYSKKDGEDNKEKKQGPGVSQEQSTECSDTKMKKGCRGDNVKVIQGYLSNLGYNVPVDGQFDQRTEDAVKKLQEENNFPQTGIMDYLTLDKMVHWLKTGRHTKQQLPSPIKENVIKNAIQKRNKQIEELVFKELVK